LEYGCVAIAAAIVAFRRISRRRTLSGPVESTQPRTTHNL
jgi:hypothetical protein